ncbi:response regulator [Halobellus salinisoli]|uniref:response regulator n=1 Tax=Halobellus salinisoli TaxID=3108500 RepID=UPI0030084E36
MSEIPGDTSIQVLHIDDHPKFSDLVKTYVEKTDDRITVHTETDPRTAIDRLDSEPIDCLVSDYQMPGMDGLDVLETVRETYPNLPFILFTGQGNEQIASDAIKAGVTNYLQKDGVESYELLANRVQNLVSQRRSEHRAQIAQDRLVQLYEQTDGFYSLDEEWTVTYWNQQIAERTGLSPDEVVGAEFWEVFPEAVETEIYDNFETVMETREEMEFELQYEPHGYWVEIRAYPVDSGLFVHSRDISEKKERENEVQYRNEVLESFANTVSHDLRNPLNIAEGHLQLAQETGDFEYLEEVAQAHNRMRNLIDELLHVARGDELDLTDISLSESAGQAWETVSAKQGELIVEEEASFKAYESQLRRLFENLFWNALDHGDATEIRVGALSKGFYVEDNGSGIPSALRDEIFDSGFSTDESSSGYGLSIVDGIADMHDWEIAAVSSDHGGARFEITGVDIDRGTA